ncbi:MAG TPA: hypothetical protein VNO54_17535, partial [Streptosporangiaceae bacterium]|nr:hypothetical protein [Streptosporangiaceae bacterium]
GAITTPYTLFILLFRQREGDYLHIAKGIRLYVGGVAKKPFIFFIIVVMGVSLMVVLMWVGVAAGIK